MTTTSRISTGRIRKSLMTDDNRVVWILHSDNFHAEHYLHGTCRRCWMSGRVAFELTYGPGSFDRLPRTLPGTWGPS